MEPAALEGIGRGARILQIALHHHVAAEHHLPHGLPVGRNPHHRFGIHHREVLQRMVAHPLPRLAGGAVWRWQGVPHHLPVIDDGGAIGFGQAIEMRDIEAGFRHRGQHRLRRRRGSGEELDRVVQRLLFAFRRIEDRRHHDGRAAQVRHLVFRQGFPDQLGAHPA